MADVDAQAMKYGPRRFRCWFRGIIRRPLGIVWNGHVWGDGGRCVDCGRD